MEQQLDMNSNKNNCSYVKQDIENYTSIELLYKGIAKQLEPKFTGDIRFEFNCETGCEIISFDWVSSAMYCDEMLWNRINYPYFKDVNKTNGLYKVNKSSYLKRIQCCGYVEPIIFLDHHHFIYFDQEFNWHITARGIIVE